MVFVPSDSLPCARGVPPIERYDLILVPSLTTRNLLRVRASVPF